MGPLAFIRKSSILLALLVMMLSSACSPTTSGATALTPTNTEVSAPIQTPVSTQVPLATQVPESTSNQLVACRPALCSDALFWQLSHNGPQALTVTVKPGLAYDATTATGRVLYSTQSSDQGVGPGGVSAGDLWWLDVRSRQTKAIISEEVVVKAAWGPSGQNFAYVRATPETYELRWYTEFGEDKLLAKDVAFTFSVSPSGNEVAFTRESNYGLQTSPGLYVVDIANGQERQVSSVDRAGRGSFQDEPLWSPDGKHLLLPITGEVYNGWIMAAADGSGAAQLSLSPQAAAVLQSYNLGFALWYPDGMHLVGSSFPGMAGGSGKIISYGLNSSLDTVVSATVLEESDATVVSWDNPGVSLWVRLPGNSLESLPAD